MKIKYLIISLLLIKNCYADKEFPLWFLTIIPTTVPTTYTNDITRHTSVSKEKQNKKEIAEFIKQSYYKLEIEIAKGEGLYLDQLIDLTKPTFESKEETIKYYREELSIIVNTCNYKRDRIEKLIESAMRKNK